MEEQGEQGQLDLEQFMETQQATGSYAQQVLARDRTGFVLASWVDEAREIMWHPEGGPHALLPDHVWALLRTVDRHVDDAAYAAWVRARDRSTWETRDAWAREAQEIMQHPQGGVHALLPDHVAVLLSAWEMLLVISNLGDK